MSGVDKIDEIDRKILSILLNDGRKSFNEISLLVGVSTGTVTNRVRKLIEKGIIRKFTVEVDWRRLGFEVDAILLIKTKPDKIGDISMRLHEYPEVSKVYIGLGGTPNIVVFVRMNNINELFSFIQNKINMFDGIIEVSSVIIDEVKGK